MAGRPRLPERAVALLACPVCAAPLTAEPDDRGLCCAAGHSFDRARHGQVTLLAPGARPAAGGAARAHPRALAVVADAWRRLPVRNGVLDRVLVTFAPRNGPETARVLRPDGRLVVVTPAPDHLRELVGALGLLRVDPDKPA